ncbi:MAG: hypothetical protein H5T86_01695 [Armatimonadetes bacterium]|nr:hypothetical protein [Armatimonadota bacterium]
MTSEPRDDQQQPERAPSAPDSGAAASASDSERPAAAQPSGRGGKRGCGVLAWIVVLAVVVAVVAYLLHQAQVQEQRRLAEEKAQRHAVRQSQLSSIGDDIAKALQYAQEGDLAKTLMILDAQQNLLATIAREASASGDQEDATQIVDYKAAVAQVADAIRQKQQELNELAVQQIASLGSKFPQVQRAASQLGAQPAEKAPEEPAATQQPQGEAAPVSPEAGQPSQQTQTQAPAVTSPGAQPQQPQTTQPAGPGP